MGSKLQSLLHSQPFLSSHSRAMVPQMGSNEVWAGVNNSAIDPNQDWTGQQHPCTIMLLDQICYSEYAKPTENRSQVGNSNFSLQDEIMTIDKSFIKGCSNCTVLFDIYIWMKILSLAVHHRMLCYDFHHLRVANHLFWNKCILGTKDELSSMFPL